MKKLFSALFVLALFGAGCGTTSTTPANMPVEQQAEVTPTPSHETRALVPATTDATWKTYTDKALNFSFMTPTKAALLPVWKVQVFASDDPEIYQSCFDYYNHNDATPTELVVAGTTEFCHSSILAPDPQTSRYTFENSYATTIAGKIVVVQFTRNLVNAALDETEYLRMLDGIIGTFKLK